MEKDNQINKTAIVLDGNLKSALSIVRSLGEAGILIATGAERQTALALHSRHTKHRFVYESPKVNQEKFIADVKAAAIFIGNKPVIYSCSDATWLTLYKYQTELQEVVTLVFPESDAVDIAFDKAATYSEANHLGVKTIPTLMPSSPSELPKLTQNIIYPAVVKARHSVAWQDGKGVFASAYFVQNYTELEAKFSDLYKKTGEAPLVQTFIKGEEYGVELLLNNGEVSAETIHHRIRSLSPTGGASVVKETIEEGQLTRGLREAAYKLAKALSWTGPLMVEFKVDNDNQFIYLMELNGRWWGSLPLSIKAGVDFPHLYYQQVAEGYRETEIFQGQPYVVSRHFLGDLVNLLRVIFARDKMRQYLYPTRRKALRDFFKHIPGTKSDVWQLTDPLPSLMEYVDVVAKVLKK